MHTEQEVVQKEGSSERGEERYLVELYLGRLARRSGADVSSLPQAFECPYRNGGVASTLRIPSSCPYLRVFGAA